MSDRRTRAVHIDDLDRIALDIGIWRPVRRPLGITAFGVNGYSGGQPGDPLIERHDERSAGAGAHEELYIVVAGAATFTIDGERIEAPAGTLVYVEPGVMREAVAAGPDTTVLVVGGRPGAGLPVSPFEYWYAAQPAADAGDPRRAIEIVSEGLREHPGHGTMHYALACYTALAGDGDAAIEHLRTAFTNDPRTREWAADDEDLDAIRDRPDWPADPA